MKAEYTIQFPEGPRTFKGRPYIPNSVRAAYAKIENTENIATDMDALNSVMRLILNTDADFTEADAMATLEVCTDFFEMFTPKTSES